MVRKIDTPELRTLVIYTQLQRMSDIETLEYLSNNNHPIASASLTRIKKRIKSDRFSTMSKLAQEGFIEQHLERIQQLELITKELWVQYNAEAQPLKKAEILSMIAEIQPLISQYHEASREVMENQVRESVSQDRQEEPSTRS